MPAAVLSRYSPQQGYVVVDMLKNVHHQNKIGIGLPYATHEA